MNVSVRKDFSAKKGISALPGTINVCMHVLGSARSDVRVMREAHALLEAGYSVSIVDIESADSRSRREEELDGVSLKHIIVSRAFAVTRFTRWPLLRAGRIFVHSLLRLLQTPADIYHAHDVNALPTSYIAACLRHKPLIFDSHELPLAEITITWRWLPFLLERLLQHIIPRCAGIITVSSPIVREIQDRYQVSDVSLIRNVPPYRLIAKSNRLRHGLEIDERTRIVLYQGGLQAGRGLDLLVRAAKFLESHIMIVIMGKDIRGTQSQLEALIREEGVAHRVKIIPPVPYAELLDWTASADIGLIVYPPDYSMNIRMCLPNKFFEYLMAGLPILASPLDAVGEIIQSFHVGRLVTTLTPDAIGTAINKMVADASALATMRRNGLAAAQEVFCWEKECKELIQLYHRLLPPQGE